MASEARCSFLSFMKYGYKKVFGFAVVGSWICLVIMGITVGWSFFLEDSYGVLL